MLSSGQLFYPPSRLQCNGTMWGSPREKPAVIDLRDAADFFVEKEGQLKILGGIKSFTEPQVLEVSELMPREILPAVLRIYCAVSDPDIGCAAARHRQ